MILMGFTVSSINYMMGGPSGGGRTGMKKTGLLKRAGVAVMTAALMVTAVACNTKIKVNFEAKASDYVKLGQYKGITVSVDEQAIENELIEKKVQNDLTSNTTYDEVSREARDKDQVTVDFTYTHITVYNIYASFVFKMFAKLSISLKCIYLRKWPVQSPCNMCPVIHFPWSYIYQHSIWIIYIIIQSSWSYQFTSHISHFLPITLLYLMTCD